MTTTSNRGYRKPVLTDTADVPRDIGNLGDDVDADMATMVNVLYQDQGADVTLTTSAQPMCSITLPGVSGGTKYLVEAQVQLIWSLAAAGRMHNVQLATSGSVLKRFNEQAVLTATSGSPQSAQRVSCYVSVLYTATSSIAVALQAYVDSASGGTSIASVGSIRARQVTY